MKALDRATVTGVTACDWPVDIDCLPEPSSDDTVGIVKRDAAISLASDVLWALSGRQFGICDALVRPCPDDGDPRRTPTSGVTSYLLSWEGDRWVNWWCGCSGGCRLSGPRAVHLPGPAQEVTAVTVAGVVQDTSSYTLEGNVLYRVGSPWPRQDLGRPAGEVNTWTVAYLRGHPVPAGVDTLTGLLAKEFLAACSGEGKCRLPRTVTSVSRQGVSYQLYNPNDIYNSGKTGLPEVDMWLASVNPNKLMAAPSVL